MEEKLKAKSFRDLVVWQRAMQLTIAVYQLTEDFPREEQYGLTNQVRRSAVSIPGNIAEGQGRQSVGEFKQFLGMARGSNFEVQTQLEIARALKFGNSVLIDDAEKLSHQVGKMIYGLMRSV